MIYNMVLRGTNRPALWTTAKMQLYNFFRKVSQRRNRHSYLHRYYLSLAKSLVRHFTPWPVNCRIVKLGTGRCLLLRGIPVPNPLGIGFYLVLCNRKHLTGHMAKESGNPCFQDSHIEKIRSRVRCIWNKILANISWLSGVELYGWSTEIGRGRRYFMIFLYSLNK